MFDLIVVCIECTHLTLNLIDLRFDWFQISQNIVILLRGEQESTINQFHISFRVYNYVSCLLCSRYSAKCVTNILDLEKWVTTSRQ